MAEKDKLFTLQNISQFYDSVWLDYAAKDGDELQYFWDDGYGVSEGFRYHDLRNILNLEFIHKLLQKKGRELLGPFFVVFVVY